jgi:hypothetical protein
MKHKANVTHHITPFQWSKKDLILQTLIQVLGHLATFYFQYESWILEFWLSHIFISCVSVYTHLYSIHIWISFSTWIQLGSLVFLFIWKKHFIAHLTHQNYDHDTKSQEPQQLQKQGLPTWVAILVTSEKKTQVAILVASDENTKRKTLCTTVPPGVSCMVLRMHPGF